MTALQVVSDIPALTVRVLASPSKTHIASWGVAVFHREVRHLAGIGWTWNTLVTYLFTQTTPAVEGLSPPATR
jgi:hypothetical protein